jgi:hypothetical protein
MANESDQVIVVGGVKLSVQYAGFTRGNVIDYETEHPGLGISVAYRGEQGESTIYIYDKGLSEITDGPMSQLIQQEFEQALQDVLNAPNGRGELISQHVIGAPGRGPEFLCAEFILKDAIRSRRTLLYLTGASGHFVKIRITLRMNDPSNSAARDFVHAVATQLRSQSNGETRSAERVTRGNVTEIGAGRYEVLGLVRIAVFGPWWWQTEALNEPNARGAIFRGYEDDKPQELAYLLVADVWEDPNEPDITYLRQEAVGELDRYLESEGRKVMANDGRRLIRWMSSKLNETPIRKGLVTAYIAEDQARERQ